MSEEKYGLKKEVAEKFEVVGDQVHAFFPGWGEVDMRELTLPAAEDLVSKKFPFLKSKEKPAKTASPK